MILTVTVALILSAAVAAATDVLVPQHRVVQSIAAGARQSYSLPLGDGDHVSGSLTQSGRANLAVYLPDGSLLRRFPAPRENGTRDFAFGAEGAGVYRLEVAAAEEPARFELVVLDVTRLDDRAGAGGTDPNPSPRMEDLRKRIAAGQAGTEAFWEQVAREGTPLVEPFGDDGRYQLVTFLWRGRHATRNVLVSGSFQVPLQTSLDFVMQRLAETDVWYLTLKLPSGARFSYRLAPNAPLARDGPRARQRRTTRQADPLNPRRWDCGPDDSRFECSSLAELPGAVGQPWIVKRPGTPEGTIDKHTIRSGIQQLERTLWVYAPPGYRPDGPSHSVLVLFDGEGHLTGQSATRTTLDNLMAASRIPPTVAVLVSNVERRRLQDLVANPEFADSMANEVVPWVRAHYNVSREAARTVVGGASAGGLAALYMALRHPGTFGNVVSQSGAVWWSPEQGIASRDTTTEGNWIARQFLAAPKRRVRFYLDAGTFEWDSEGGGGDVLEASRHLRDVLLAKGYEVHYQQFVGGHDGASWRGTLADGLIALMGSSGVPLSR
jgi:enterochelin esterase family protein